MRRHPPFFATEKSAAGIPRRAKDLPAAKARICGGTKSRIDSGNKNPPRGIPHGGKLIYGRYA